MHITTCVGRYVRIQYVGNGYEMMMTDVDDNLITIQFDKQPFTELIAKFATADSNVKTEIMKLLFSKDE